MPMVNGYHYRGKVSVYRAVIITKSEFIANRVSVKIVKFLRHTISISEMTNKMTKMTNKNLTLLS